MVAIRYHYLLYWISKYNETDQWINDDKIANLDDLFNSFDLFDNQTGGANYISDFDNCLIITWHGYR